MPAYVKPTLKVEIDFTGNPTATMADILNSADDIVSFWRMNSTTTMVDDRGTNDGVIVSTPTTTAGAYQFDSDLALSFDGAGDAAYVPAAGGLLTNSAMSVAFWLQVPSFPAGTRDVIAKRGSWLVRIDSAGHLILTLKDDTSTVTVTGTTVLSTGVWYHVAAVYTNTSALLYLNGTLETSSAYSSGMSLVANPVRLVTTPSTGSSPTWQASTTGSTSTGPAKPASLADGELLLLQMSWESTVTVATVASGWTLLSAVVTAGANPRSDSVYAKLVTNAAGEPATYGFTLTGGGGYAYGITRFSGVDQLVPVTDAYGAGQVATTSHPTGTHLPSVDNNLVAALFSKHEGATSHSISSGTERYDTAPAGSIAMSTQTQATATSLNVTSTSTGGGFNGSAFFIVLAGTTATYLNAKLDDISVWSRALTATDVAGLYASRLSGVGTWVDVSSDVRQVQIRGGRQYELDRMEARTATVILNDKLRKYDPANQSSTYWPNVVPMRRIRVSLIHSAVTYPVFTGFVERWPPETIGPRYQEVTVSAVDGFDGLARASLSGSVATTFAGAQINEILDKAYWPETDRNLDAGQYVMIGDSDINTTALQAIQDIADSELGVFFLDGEGQATFHDRAHRGTNSRSTTSQASFVETSNSTVTYHELSPSFDRDRIINTWEVSPHSAVLGGTVQTATDADSIAKYFLRTSSRSTKLSSNTDALAQANQLLNETSQPALRFDVLVLVPYTSAQWSAVLPLQISDRVTVTRTPVPSAGGTTIVRDCFIEGMSWAITPSSIQFSLQLSPVSSGDYYHTIVRDGPVSYWRMDTVT